jgi:hypothetical protein
MFLLIEIVSLSENVKSKKYSATLSNKKELSVELSKESLYDSVVTEMLLCKRMDLEISRKRGLYGEHDSNYG